MKRGKNIIVTFFLTALIIVECIAQDIDLSLFNGKWKPGKEKIVYGHKILKVSGVSQYGYTNISYSSKEDLIAKVKKNGEKEMLSTDQIQKDVDAYMTIGGAITLYIGRLTIGSANTENFLMVIQDLDGKELSRENLKSDIPQTPGSDRLWWNTGTMILKDPELVPPFNVFVVDRLDDKNPRYQFQIIN